MVIDFHAHYPRQEDFLPRLIDALPKKVEELAAGKQIHDKIFEHLNLDKATMDEIYGGTAARLLHLLP